MSKLIYLLFILILFSKSSYGFQQPSCEDYGYDYDECGQISSQYSDIFFYVLLIFLGLVFTYTRIFKVFTLSVISFICLLYLTNEVAKQFIGGNNSKYVVALLCLAFIKFTDKIFKLFENILDSLLGKEPDPNEKINPKDTKSENSPNREMEPFIRKNISQNIPQPDSFNEYIANKNRINSKRIYNKLDTNEKKGDLEASQIDQIEIEAENNEKLDVLEKSLLEKISYNIALVLIWLDSLPEDKVIINAHKMVLRKNSIRYIEENNIGVSAFKEIKERSNYYKLLLLSQVMLEVEYAPSLQDEVLIKINNNEFNNFESLDSNEITKMVNNLTSNLYNKTIKIDNIDLNINEW